MKRIALILLALVAVVAVVLLVRSREEAPRVAVDTVPIDTTPVNLDTLQAAIPEAAPDTFTRPKLPEAPVRTVRQSYAPAPPALMDAVERERTFTRFCYEEFGQKADPELRGGVAMLVTVGPNGVSEARVANDSWTSQYGKTVNRCLNERAKDAWRLPAGAVKPGVYQVDLAFRPA
ncbi:MAG TPA: hypothetical protein VFS05_03805 [Gemmatimonadaceae bacterium]|nr:hypothetical protein [Gemmatimonadaceae bacterium]